MAGARGTRQASSPSLTQVGFVPLPGFNADVWAHEGFAYVGTWGAGLFPDFCPATGVRIIDLSDPSNPAVVGAVATIPGTTQEDVVVQRIDTPFFHGDLLATGIQTCVTLVGSHPHFFVIPAGPVGIDLWDVTDPRNPQLLAFWPSAPEGAFEGVHELHLFQQGEGAFVAAAVPFQEFSGLGDFRLVEVTDPRNPVGVGEWGVGDVGLGPFCDPHQCFFDHSAFANAAGTQVILSYWDAGAIYLDISDPAQPTFVGRTLYPVGSDGDTHSIALAGENLLLTADEDFSPLEGGEAGDTWGFLRIWDVTNPAAPVQIGRFGTPNSLSTLTHGFFSIHNPFVLAEDPSRAYLSWYSDGVRVVDISQPSAPHEIASFVPPATADPFGVLPTAPLVWGVYVDDGLILASDINAGLYVLE